MRYYRTGRWCVSTESHHSKMEETEQKRWTEKNGTTSEKKKDGDECPTTVTLPPDGGFGWVIVIIGFLGGVIVDGIIFSFGIVYPEMLLTFNSSKSETAWIGSVMAGTSLTVGPIVSALANRYGCRLACIVGAVIAAFGLFLSVFATDINYLVLSYGILGGIGFGFIYLPCIVMVQFYFDKRRAFATGISVCGSGMGAFIFAPLSTFLIRIYGWRGNMLVQSAIVMNMVALGALLLPLQDGNRRNRRRIIKKSPKKEEVLSKSDLEQSLKQHVPCGYTRSSLLIPKAIIVEEEENVPLRNRSNTLSLGYDKDGLLQCGQRSPSYLVKDDPFSMSATNVEGTGEQKNLPDNPHGTKRPFYRKDIFFSGSLLRLPQYCSQPSLQHYHCSVLSIPEGERPKTIEDGRCPQSFCPATVWNTIAAMLDFSLLRSVTFLVLCTASFITMMGFFVPFVYLADFATTVGLSKEDSSVLFAVIGVSNTLGRIFCGWVSDRPQVNALLITNVALTCGGLATIIVPFLLHYNLLLIYSFTFGLAIACFASLRSIILVELLGLEKLTNAFGLLLLFQGVASMIGSPMAGFFYDITNSYNTSFVIAGLLIAISGLLGFPLPYISELEKRRNTEVATKSGDNSYEQPSQ